MATISVRADYLAPSDPSLPAIAVQITQLVGSYMIWAGIAESPEDADKAPLRGFLCKDWACAMPSKFAGMPSPATSLFRSSSSDVALSMAQRLATRFQKQIFLSVDLPSSFLSAGQGPKLLLGAERGIVEILKGMDSAE